MTKTDDLRLSYDQLSRVLDPASLPFETTDAIPPLSEVIGQPRALDAIEFGLAVDAPGYNLFMTGAPGSGRESAIRATLGRYAPTRPTPSDWVYVYNFADPDRPYAIALAPGEGTRLAKAMQGFVTAAQREIVRAFESEDYARRQQEIMAELARRRDTLFSDLQSFALERGFALQQTPVGIASVPLVDGHPVSVQEFDRLPAEQKTAIEERSEQLQVRIGETMRQAHQLEQETGQRVRQMDQDVAMYVVGPLLDDLRAAYVDRPQVLTYLEELQKDLPERLADFRPARASDGETPAMLAQVEVAQREASLKRYEVNVFIDHSQTHGAPVVFETNPTYYNLVGRLDYRASFGALVTSFQQVKPGALHRANGGFLVLRATDLLRVPFAWDSLKRALLSRAITIENLGEQYTALPTETLRPEPIPLSLKIILIGPLQVYHLLYELDEDFQELFKVKADFAPDMDWTQEQVLNYAAFISGCVRQAGLLPFSRSAVARVVEYGARLREDKRKLSTRLLDISDIVTEASFWARRDGQSAVRAEDVEQAMLKKVYRSNLAEQRILEMIADGTILIDTSGARVGQVNGIAILDLGDYAFGKPSRISARIARGSGSVQSIERETHLSGDLHSKGVLILVGYLHGQYAQENTLPINATLTFEQSYDEVDGDSAAAAELYAVLSALADVPIQQGIAVTGSVNQFGAVQAVGGVTRKIEGYFAVCQALGLTGEQGVIIPAANVPNLMLKAEVVEAVRAGRFHIWAIRSIDDGIEILTGLPAGERGADGHYPEGTIHRRAEDKLHRYSELAKRGDGRLRHGEQRRRSVRT